MAENNTKTGMPWAPPPKITRENKYAPLVLDATTAEASLKAMADLRELHRIKSHAGTDTASLCAKMAETVTCFAQHPSQSSD